MIYLIQTNTHQCRNRVFTRIIACYKKDDKFYNVVTGLETNGVEVNNVTTLQNTYSL